MSDFHVEIKTADEFHAGTDSNIFLILYGERGQSNEERLNQHISGDAFERNQLDTVDLTGWPDLGRIYKIRIRSDTRYLGSDWRLSWVRVTPRNPDYPPSTFSYENWISDTNGRDILAQDWPWPLDVRGAMNEEARGIQINMIDLLGTTIDVKESYTVKYQIEDQVQVATDVKETSELTNKISWKSPDALKVAGQFSDDFSARWQQEVQNHRVQQSSQQLTTEDTQQETFPAGKLTLVRTEWPEQWTKCVATLGSDTFAMRWLNTVPAKPSWTVGTYAKGDVIPEPFATWMRLTHPDLVPLFQLQASLPEPGRSYSITSKNSGKVLDVSGQSTANGAQVWQWDWWDGDNQKWEFIDTGNSTYMIRCKHSGKVLDVSNVSRDNGAIVWQWDWWGGDNQKWRLVPQPDGTFEIVSVNSGKALDVQGVSRDRGAPVWQWDWWNGPNQRWTLEPRE